LVLQQFKNKIMKDVLKLYNKLCIEYNDKNIQNLCSLQTFLNAKYNSCKNGNKRALIYEVIKYAENDF